MSKYELLFAQASDTEGHLFRMIFLPEDGTNSLGNGTCFVRGYIYVIDQNWVS